jgi:hypothetical protein
MIADALATTTVALWLLLVAGLSLVVHQEVSPPTLGLDFWRPDQHELSTLQATLKARLEAVPDRSIYQPLVDAMVRRNQAGAGLDQLEYQQGLILLEREVASQARQFSARHGVGAYLAVGTLLSEQLYRDLALVGAALYEQQMPLQDWLAARPDDPVLLRLRGVSGQFLERAVSAGLLGHQRAPERDRLLVARTLWMEHFALVAGLQPEAVLDPVETRLTLRWKIEAADHLEPARRQQLLSVATARLPGYPGRYVGAVLALKEGDEAGALNLFLECLDAGEEVERAHAWVLSLRRFSWDSFL